MLHVLLYYADFISLILDPFCVESKGRSEKAHSLESVAAFARESSSLLRITWDLTSLL